MKRLSLLDLGFFITETKDSPKHVAGLMIFKKPAGAPENFVHDLYEEFRSFDEPVEPFNQVIDFIALGGPRWRTADEFDIDQHVFYHRPEKVLTRRKLFDGAARLHTPELDRTRPLWEFHIIDRVQGGRFAIYSKIHHAYADGVTLVDWTARGLSESREDLEVKPVWVSLRKRRRRRASKQATAYMLRNLVTGSLSRYKTTKGLAKLVAQLALEQVGLTRNAVSLPFRSGGHTELTGRTVPERQFAKASVPMSDVQRIRDMCRATLNHVALTCVDGALHRYLEEQGEDPRRPISIQMPVSLRSKGDRKEGNRIGLVTVDLANRTSDPYERLREIGFTLRNVRNQVDNVPPDSVVMYSIITGLGAQLTEMFGLSDVLPPISDTLVSNVPGPRNPLYLKGALLEEMCPVSTLMPGNRLNITLFSYAGTLHFGLIGTRQLGDLSKLADYIEQAFVDLEKAVFHPRSEIERPSKGRRKGRAKKARSA
ncbi:MAG: wax ester/triacylglycerol synthase family O-acyltransferase [Gammaproteobacteria bacterium]|jgi:WS/DGAT/MGAT family acyltransferase